MARTWSLAVAPYFSDQTHAQGFQHCKTGKRGRSSFPGWKRERLKVLHWEKRQPNLGSPRFCGRDTMMNGTGVGAIC